MQYDIKITGGSIVDGSGKPAYKGDVGIKDGRIVALGKAPGEARQTIDATGKAVSPGFVDTPLTAQNDFPMPMCWPVDKAARHIADRLDKRPFEIAFPGPFIFLLSLLAHLPKRLQLALDKRMARSSANPESTP